MTTNIVFMGSPEFAVPTFLALVEKYHVVGVVTQPDRPAGRGRKLTACPIKIQADQFEIPTIQPNRLKDPGVFDQLVAWKPDVIVVAAFGQILRQNVLDLPKYGCINVHASLLPRWRGAAPIQAAILNGDKMTGVSIMKLDAGIDTGPVLFSQELPIMPDDTAGILSDKLARLGAEVLPVVMDGYLKGLYPPVSQDNEKSTYAAMIEKNDGLLDFTKPANHLERLVRAYQPWPGAFFLINSEVYKIQKSHVEPGGQYLPGQRVIFGKLPAVGTVDGALVIETLQPPGKRPMPGDEFLRGFRNWDERSQL